MSAVSRKRTKRREAKAPLADKRPGCTEATGFPYLDTLTDTQLAGEQTLVVGPLEGHLLEGSGKDNETGDDMYVFQAILVDEKDKYYRLVGQLSL